jgi:hypothetical protein
MRLQSGGWAALNLSPKTVLNGTDLDFESSGMAPEPCCRLRSHSARGRSNSFLSLESPFSASSFA